MSRQVNPALVDCGEPPPAPSNHTDLRSSETTRYPACTPQGSFPKEIGTQPAGVGSVENNRAGRKPQAPFALVCGVFYENQ